MRQVRSRVFRVVKAETPEEFENRVQTVINEMREVSDLKLYDDYLAYIVGDTFKEIPENASDRARLADSEHLCSDCIQYIPPENKVRKWTKCAEGENTRADSCCCNWFYEQIEKGENLLK